MAHNHYPVETTVLYMERCLEIEKDWDTTLQKARRALLQTDPRQLYFDFLTDLKRQIEQNSPKSEALAELLRAVAIRGFGMSRQQIHIRRPPESETRWRIHLDENAVRRHLDDHIVGEHFLNRITADKNAWGTLSPVIGGSDVSQHKGYSVPFPGRFFKRHAPYVLNNAAGTLRKIQDGRVRFDNVFNPRTDEELLRWMLIDPSYQEELEEEDYKRCLISAMDVGHYKFDFTHLMKAEGRPPNIIFKDGSLFPQDAKLHNFFIENKRGDFIREAIREMLSCLIYAKEIGVIYCGVAKQVQLNVYSAVVDWFIEKEIDPNWELGNYTLSDGQAMSLLLAFPDLVEDNLERTVVTCLIRRSFTTRATLNDIKDLDDLDTYFSNYQALHQEVDITPYQRLCELAHIYMFFIGHSKNPQQQLPRYEFFYTDSLGKPQEIVQKILSSLQTCGFMIDRDHSFMAVEPVRYLIPTVTQQAHHLSKQAGEQIASEIGQKITARFQSKRS